MKNSFALLLAILFTASASIAQADQAADNTFTLTSQSAGVTPFIAKLTFTTSDLTVINKVQFSITPKLGSVTRPLAATYTKAYLRGRGYVDTTTQQVTVPVFGLYNGYNNQVVITCFYSDGSSTQSTLPVQTAVFDSPFNSPNVVQARTNTTQLSYDYILVASSISPYSPTIIDTDGALRWVGTSGSQNHYTAFYQNGVYHFSGSKLIRMELDGEFRVLADYASQSVVGFSHNIDKGKYGIILNPNTTYYVDCVSLEVDARGRILKKWNLADIISAAMKAGGDDPSGFVKKSNGNYGFSSPADWAHTNSATYRKSDDTIIISSRENFVIGVDYSSGAIKWILGDTTKQWYQYASLRKFALALGPDTIAPDGQHAVSITHDDRLLLFDNGEPSAHHTPAGPRRSYAAGRKYELDLVNKVATEVWTFDNNKSVKCAFRSSIYEDAPENYLVDYAVARNPDGSIRGEILGLLPSGEKVFDYSYPTKYGYIAYRSVPIHLENLKFPLQTKTQLANISARSNVQTGDNVSIAGFIVSDPVPKKVLVRGLGPSLAANGQPIPGRLMNPKLELFDSAGRSLQSNDDYKNGPEANSLIAAGLAPSDDSEAAIVMELAPGAYTGILRGNGNTTGIGLVEVYDLAVDETSELINLSARAYNSGGDNILIGGVILQGDLPRPVLVRALGPELQAKGLPAFDDTTLDIYDANGVRIGSNDDWRQASNAAAVEQTGIAPTDDRESAVLVDAAVAGSYTCVARGKAESGVIALEAYRLN